MDVELNELHHIVSHAVVVLSLNNKQWATRPRRRCRRRCAENVRTWSCALTARRSHSGWCDSRAARTLSARWEMRIPITWRCVCRPEIPLSACQNVRKGEIRKKKEKGTKKKKKEQLDEALGFQAKSYRPVVSAQRSRWLLGWALGVQIDEMDLMPFLSLLQQQQQNSLVSSNEALNNEMEQSSQDPSRLRHCIISAFILF